MNAHTPLAEIVDYAGLITALRERARARLLVLSSETNNAVAGLPDKYLAKVLAPVASAKKRLGLISLGPVLGVLGCKLVLVEDAEAMRLYAGRLEYRRVMLGAPSIVSVSLRELRCRADLGRANRWKKTPSVSRAAHARKMAWARWRKKT